MVSASYCSSLQAYPEKNYCMPLDPMQRVTYIHTTHFPPKQNDDHAEMTQTFECILSLEQLNKYDRQSNDFQKQDPKTQLPNWQEDFLACHQLTICGTRFDHCNFHLWLE
jgi:hypothetical protein